ncbi:MAG: radical SAM protein [Desulfuromonadaceae bacterium]|nr:radical SAM protein [Desulfuromonadaceae bacterium]
MKILFVTLHARRSPQATPLAAGCLVAALPATQQADCVLLDFFPDHSETEILAALREEQPDIIIEPIYLWNRERIGALNRHLRAEYPALILIGGGPEATADPTGTLAACALSVAVRGAGEGPLPTLLAALAEGRALATVAGITYATGTGICHTPDAPRCAAQTFNSPWLNRSLVAQPASGVLWEVARGCSFSCDFCFDAGGVRGVQALPLNRLEQEWELFCKTGIAQLWVLDSTFNVPPARGKRLLRMLLRHPADIHLHFEAKAEHLDRETVALLSRLPCSVQVGLQSTHAAVLRAMHRPFDFDRFSAGVTLLNSAGITFGIDLIYGLPGDSAAGFRQSLDRVLALQPNHLDIFPLAVLPGTTLAERCTEFGLRAQVAPPYTLLEANDFSAADLAACDQLAAACGLFYNCGRAVGLLSILLAACELDACAFLEGFWRWLTADRHLSAAELTRAENWSPARVLPLQHGYLAELLRQRHKEHLRAAVEDLLNDRFYGAETLLGPETLPPADVAAKQAWTRRWRTAETLRLGDFHYEIDALQSLGGKSLERFVHTARATGSTALYLRRNGELICESLSDEFARLLKMSDGSCTPEEIFAGRLPRTEAEELLLFAVQEGLLVKA